MSIDAIKAVVDLIEINGVVSQEDIVKCLRSAIEQAEKQEPVAYFDAQERGFYWAKPTVNKVPKSIITPPVPLYTAPPQRQPLTDEEIKVVIRAGEYDSMEEFARAIERAHGIGGGE